MLDGTRNLWQDRVRMLESGQTSVVPPDKGTGEPALPAWIEKAFDILDGTEKMPSGPEAEAVERMLKERAERIGRLDLSRLPRWHAAWLRWMAHLPEGMGARRLLGLHEGHGISWVEEVEKGLSRLSSPGVNMRAFRRAPAVQFGTFVGHQIEWNLRARDKNLPGTEALPKEFRDWVEAFFRENQARRVSRLQRVLALGCEQSLEVAREFYRGVSVGLQKEVFRKDEGLTGDLGRGRVLMFLWLYWPFVEEELESVPELYSWLCALLGKNIVGRDMNRLEKICGDLGLKLRERGRPKLVNTEG